MRPGRSCFLSPPEVAITYPPGLLYSNSTHLCTYSHTQLLPILMDYLNTTLPILCLSVCIIDCFCFSFWTVSTFCLLNSLTCIWTQTLFIPRCSLVFRGQNTDGKHGSSRESSALWSDYRPSENGDLSSSHSKGADRKTSEVNGSAPAGDGGRRFCPDILDFGGRAGL